MGRPYGTCLMYGSDPALKRWANIECPSGARNQGACNRGHAIKGHAIKGHAVKGRAIKGRAIKQTRWWEST